MGKKAATVGIGLIAAGAIAIAPTVQAPPPAAPAPAIRLTAQVQQLAPSFDPFSVADWFVRIATPPSAGNPFPQPQFPPVVTPTSIGTSIIGIYNAVEPWVRYGFDLAAYAVGWIPTAGWLAPQITIFYNFGERIARSITYNIAFWLDGDISFAQGLVNVGIDTINSFIFLANDQLAFWLQPLPPLPPIFLPFGAQQAPLTAAESIAPDAQAPTAPTPLGDALQALQRLFAGPRPVTERTPPNIVAEDVPVAQNTDTQGNALDPGAVRVANAPDGSVNEVQNVPGTGTTVAPAAGTTSAPAVTINTGTSDTETGKTNPAAAETSPSDGKTNLSPGNANPSVGTKNPSVGTKNPSAGKTNPTADKTNRYAGTTRTPGAANTTKDRTTAPNKGRATDANGDRTTSTGDAAA